MANQEGSLFLAINEASSSRECTIRVKRIIPYTIFNFNFQLIAQLTTSKRTAASGLATSSWLKD